MLNDATNEFPIYDGICAACGTDRPTCPDCGLWLECPGTCGEPADCKCDKAATPVELMDEVDTIRVEIEAVPAKVWARMTEIMMGGAR